MQIHRLAPIARRAGFGLLTVPALAALINTSVSARDHKKAAPAFSPERIKAQITYLASDALKGRDSGEPGNEAAARFIAQEFARSGLKPLGTRRQRDASAPCDGSGYFQPFQFRAGRAVGKNNRLEATLDGKTIAYRSGQDYEPAGISGGGKAEGDVVFVGYGIRAPQAGHDDYDGVDVRGKIVVLLAGIPGNDPHGPLADHESTRSKSLTARELGATALLVIPPQNSDARGVPPTAFADSDDAGLPVLQVRRTVVETWFHALSGSENSLEKWEAAANTAPKANTLLPVHLRLSADVAKVEKVTANIVGLIEGSDPVLKNEVVVIGAHMDHLGMGGPYSLARSSEPAIHHGADDNASGTAGVLQLARYFGRSANSAGASSSPLKRSLLLICFSGEERGLLGSQHYAQHPLVPLDKTVAMLNMDMVGRLRENKLIVIGSGTAKEWDSLLDAANQTAGFALARSEDGFGASDQQSFYSKDVPVLFFFTGSHADYHTPTDTADKINAEGEAHVLQIVADCARRIANAPDRPTFQRIKLPDQNAGRRGFPVYFGSIPDYAAQVEGVRLNGVREGSPAEKAGLKAGDILIKFGDKTVKSVQDYAIVLRDYRPGDQVDVVVKRGEQTLTLHVTLAARPNA